MSRATDIIDRALKESDYRAYNGGDQNGTPTSPREIIEVIKAAFDAYIEDDVGPEVQGLKDQITRLEEKIEVLDGSRNIKALPKAAVRFQDFRTLRQFNSQASINPIGGTPTAADFNALRSDVARILVVFSDLSSNIGARSE